MIRGIETLSELEETIRSLRADIASIDARREKLFAATQENKGRQAEILKEIAALHLDDLADGEDAADYRSDTQIRSLLSQRETSFAQLTQEIQRLSDEISSQEAGRKEAHYRLEEALMRLAKIQEEVQQHLKADPRYQAQLKQTEEARGIAEATTQKATEAIENYREKMHPFEASRLFWYLWQRGYGTAEYRGGGLSRLLDGWVAKRSNYEQNRQIYWRLSQIPVRLKQHADAEAQKYRKSLDALIVLEQQEASSQGMDKAKEEVERRQQEVDRLDARIAAAEEKLDSLLEEQKRYLHEQDRYAREIAEQIAALLSHYGASTISEIAAKTRNKRDDRLVAKLRELEENEQTLQQQLAENRQHYEKQLTALRETEALRRRFKASRYDDIRSGFDNNIGMGTILGEVIGGALNNAGAWERMSRHQQPLDNGWLSDFGSGGFSQNDSPWYSPGSFDLPDIGGAFDSDSFRTGGGF
jgi:chromosome segregation ATPase